MTRRRFIASTFQTSLEQTENCSHLVQTGPCSPSEARLPSGAMTRLPLLVSIALLVLPRAALADDSPGPPAAVGESSEEAEPQDGSDAPATVAQAAQTRLDEAVRSYQLGKRLEARDALVALVNDPRLEDARIRQTARIYLGELLYVSGDKDGAQRFFELVLEEDPSYIIDPYRHPPDVCGHFNYVRSYKVPVGSGGPDLLPTLERESAPASAWAPFGVYHFTRGKPLRGSIYAATTSAAGVVSLVLAYRLAGDRTWTEGDGVELQRLRRLKLAQYTAGGSFYALWGITVLDAHVHWQRGQRDLTAAPPTSSLGLSPGFVVRGRF